VQLYVCFWGVFSCESRHRKQRGEVVITVDSSESVRDIKLELMKLYSVMPLDQHLSLNGKVLEDGETLGAAGVRPGSILLLKVSRNIDLYVHSEQCKIIRYVILFHCFRMEVVISLVFLGG
jgi:hypothetical protein